jgi:hypothetical protein
MKRVWLLTIVFLMLMCRSAPAPLYGSFEGLDKLIEGAEFIVVAEIIKRPAIEETDMGGGGTYEIEIAYVIKGDAKPGSLSQGPTFSSRTAQLCVADAGISSGRTLSPFPE